MLKTQIEMYECEEYNPMVVSQVCNEIDVFSI